MPTPELEPPTIESLRVKAQANALAKYAPHASTFWIVVSWYAPGGYWKLWPDMWTSQSEAEVFAKQLPRGHTHAAVVEVGVGVQGVAGARP